MNEFIKKVSYIQTDTVKDKPFVGTPVSLFTQSFITQF